jgi:hypothetical protein
MLPPGCAMAATPACKNTMKPHMQGVGELAPVFARVPHTALVQDHQAAKPAHAPSTCSGQGEQICFDGVAGTSPHSLTPIIIPSLTVHAISTLSPQLKGKNASQAQSPSPQQLPQ